MPSIRYSWVILAAAGAAVTTLALTTTTAQQATAQSAQSAAKKPAKKPDFPPFSKVSKGLTKVVSTTDGATPLYELWENTKEAKLLAVLPRSFEKQLLMIAPTVAAGDEQAGVMGGTIYARWERIGKRLALIEPNFLVRSHGDAESKRSIKQLYADRVILDVPIVAMAPGGKPVIDMTGLFLGQSVKFFGPGVSGFVPPTVGVKPKLAKLVKAKAFPQNLEIAYRVPDRFGRLRELYYSVRNIPENRSYKPRNADGRVGFFNVVYNEMGTTGDNDSIWRRYITRWQLEKADPKAKVSPPKQPIVWYIENTVPIRYRRFVRQGILDWNKAFRKVGIVNAVEVYQQDATTGAHMDKDPEDARYNFFRWNTSNQGYAIGPSRWDPRTGQILDADVVWHAGLTRAVRGMLRNLSGDIAVAGFTPETLTWLDEHPQWDPRVRFMPPAKQEAMIAQANARVTARATALQAPEDMDPGVPTGYALDPMIKTFVGEPGAAACRIGDQLALQMGLFTAALDAGLIDAPEDAEDGDTLDGLPEAFLGEMIRYITSHEVGHCLGLQHNFSASTIHTLAEINSPDWGDKPTVGSVMEYVGPNINKDLGEVQGPYATPEVGPYDKWAITFGYGDNKTSEESLKRVNEHDLVWHSPYATIGPDPRAQVWDMGADPLKFAQSRMEIVHDLRSKLPDLVKDGQSWKKARSRWNTLLGTQVQMLATAARWVGGSYVNWDHKGDPGDRDPVENVPSAKQREALKFVLDNSFNDDAFGVSSALLHKLGKEYFPDGPGLADIFNDTSYPITDTIGAVQATALTLIMNPTTLRRVYDNEQRMREDEDNPITLAEVMRDITDAVWTDLTSASAFQRNLQREHLDRLMSLSLNSRSTSATMRTIAALSTQHLRSIQEKAQRAARNARTSDYVKAHLADVTARIERTLDAQYTVRR